MELLRIIAMFLVLIVHANYYSLSAPTTYEIESEPIPSFFRCFFQTLSIICVNVFVLISGWFGMKFSFRSLQSFLFQVLFYSLGIYMIIWMFGLANFSLKCLLVALLCNHGGMWFIYAYLGLFFLSPVLNAFIENSSKKNVEICLAVYFCFELIYGWLLHSSQFNDGSSILSFIGLYLLARYLHEFPSCMNSLSSLKYSILFIILVLGVSIMHLFCLSSKVEIMHMLSARLFFYNSPYVIIASVILLLLFSKINFTSRVVNFIAASSFSVYLIHCHGEIFNPLFKKYMIMIFEKYDGVLYLLIVALSLVLIYLFSLLLDQIRMFLYKRISCLWG